MSWILTYNHQPDQEAHNRFRNSSQGFLTGDHYLQTKRALEKLEEKQKTGSKQKRLKIS